MTITILRAVIIYVSVIVAVRIMGKRQVGELSTHEFVIAILISSVATMPLEDNAIPLTNSLMPVIIFISLEILQSALSMKLPKFRDLFDGKPILVIKDGVLQQHQLRRLRLTVCDLLDSLRQQSVFDITQVENAVVETNGKLSVQLKSSASPPTAEALHKATEKSTLPVAVIADGKVLCEYFGDEKISEAAVRALAAASGKQMEDIMLLTVDENGKLTVIEKEKE